MSKNDRRVRSLAFDECANHFHELNGHRNWCVAREKVCVFASGEDLPRCGCFERGVLPLDPEAQAVYLAERRAVAQGHTLTALQTEIVREAFTKPQARVKCVKCGEIFLAASGRQQYCPECRKAVKREQSKARMSRRRSQVI